MDEKARIKASFDAIINQQIPYNQGALKDSDAYGKIEGNCGDTMEIFLEFDHDIVVEASYKSDGCAFSNLCGSLAAGLAMGKHLEALPKISGAVILGIMDNFPREEEHCAFLAVATLREAFKKYQSS